jgi:type II secretory pathway pseudopilin PulG
MTFCHGKSSENRQDEGGYVLLVLLLLIAMLSIGFLGVMESIDFEIRRDREEEMIHRGAQYSRAVRKFINQFQRYPASIEELENTNNMRFLRKRYKDPITGKDFKVLHLSDMPSFIRTPVGAASAAGLPQQQGTRGTSGDVALANVVEDNVVQDTEAAGLPTSEQRRQTDSVGLSPDGGGDAPQSRTPGSLPATSKSGPQPVHGLIIGVASTSQKKSIREFNKKDHYNQWQFIYDPSTDGPGLLRTPNQPLRALQLNQGVAMQAAGTDSGPTSTTAGFPHAQQ